MLERNLMHSLIVITALTSIIGCGRNANAQKHPSETISFPTLLRMFADQHDHMADRTIVMNNSVVKIRFAKKQGKTRQEFYPLDQADTLKNESLQYYKIITISKFNQPTTAFDPQEKTYAE